ncbi:MAG: hypothetical protein RML94_08390 [Bacteroidia bacterium]|nr:hypothetical protein [Bacteroidia bacterium]
MQCSSREACGGCVSSAKHRSDSVARSTPTRAQRGTRPKNYFIFYSYLRVFLLKLAQYPVK